MTGESKILWSKLMQASTDIENIKDYIKIIYVDGKISQQEGSELIRLLDESNQRIVDYCPTS